MADQIFPILLGVDSKNEVPLLCQRHKTRSRKTPRRDNPLFQSFQSRSPTYKFPNSRERERLFAGVDHLKGDPDSELSISQNQRGYCWWWRKDRVGKTTGICFKG